VHRDGGTPRIGEAVQQRRTAGEGAEDGDENQKPINPANPPVGRQNRKSACRQKFGDGGAQLRVVR
jgi:hypothetical protein